MDAGDDQNNNDQNNNGIADDIEAELANLKDQQNLIGSNSCELNTQRESIYDQLTMIRGNVETYKSTLKKNYKEYVNLKEKNAQLKRSLPVNYLTDGKIYKGYNEAGQLVAVYDRYENAMSIEYDEGGKIVCVYDGDSKQIVFDYRSNGLLDSITDTRGRRTTYDYDTSGQLTQINFADGKTLKLNLSGSVLTVESSDYEQAILNLGTSASSLTWKTKLSSVANGNIQTTTGWTQKNKVTISWGSTQTKLSDTKGNVWYYRLDTSGKVYEYYEEQNGKVTKAEKYEVSFDEYEKITHAKRTSLYKAYTSFTAADFTDGDWEKVTYNAYRKPSQREQFRTIQANTTEQTTVTYVYDGDQRCVRETAAVIVKKGSSTLKTYTQITEYSYNAGGDVVRKESW